MKKKNLKCRLIFLYVFSFIATSAPIATAVVMNAGEWFREPGESVKLGIGVILASIFLALKAFGKLKLPRRIVTFGIVFAMTYFLQSILADLLLLSGMAFLGEVIDLLLFQAPIKRTKEAITAEKAATVTASKIEDIIEKYVGSGRT